MLVQQKCLDYASFSALVGVITNKYFAGDNTGKGAKLKYNIALVLPMIPKETGSIIRIEKHEKKSQ